MFLKHTDKTTLQAALMEFSPAQIRTVVGSTIFGRGENYYATGAVEDISYSDSLTLDATVSGSEYYQITVSLHRGSIDADCDCPYDDVCKHIVAVLLTAENEGAGIEGFDEASKQEDSVSNLYSAVKSNASTSELNTAFQDYVLALSQKELQDLVLRFAPEDFRRTMITTALDENDANTLLTASEKKVQWLLSSTHLRHDIEMLERKLMHELEAVRGLWAMFPQRIAKMLVEIIQTINDGVDEGDFVKGYDGEEIFGSEKFDDYVVAFIHALPLAHKPAIINDFEKVISEANYAIFENIPLRKNEWYSSDELPSLKDALIQALRKKTYKGSSEMDYKMVSSALSDDEREYVLTMLFSENSSLTLELVAFYEKKERPAEALKTLDTYFQKSIENGPWYNPHKNQLVKRRLELAAALGEAKDVYAKTAEKLLTETQSAELLSIAANYLGDLVRPIEITLGKRNPSMIFAYFNLQQRFDECWGMIQHSLVRKDLAYAFAVEHLKKFPEKAAPVLIRHIEEQKQIADNSAYRSVAEALHHLNTIDSVSAKAILLDLRTNFKRRTNMMKELNRYF